MKYNNFYYEEVEIETDDDDEGLFFSESDFQEASSLGKRPLRIYEALSAWQQAHDKCNPCMICLGKEVGLAARVVEIYIKMLISQKLVYQLESDSENTYLLRHMFRRKKK